MRRLLVLYLSCILLTFAVPQTRGFVFQQAERPEVQAFLEAWAGRQHEATQAIIKYVKDQQVTFVGGKTVITTSSGTRTEVDTTDNFSLRHGPSLTAEEYEAVLAEYKSPAAGKGVGEASVRFSEKYQIDNGYVLAQFIVESGAGKAGVSAGENTRNPGNIKCFGFPTCYQNFRVYETWPDGFEAHFALLAEYRDTAKYGNPPRKHETIRDAISTWAPSDDNNDPNGYANTVERMVSSWRSVHTANQRAQEATQAVPEASGGFVEPWAGFFDSQCAGLHDGARDYCSPEGTVVRAPFNGTFVGTGRYEDAKKFGDYFIFNDDEGLEWYFGHLKEVNPEGLKPGDRVMAGMEMGKLGPFSYSTPHTHNQLRKGGALTDPGPVYEARKSQPKPSQSVAGGTSDLRAKVIELALSRQGDPYVSGGRTAGGSDCSGFVQYVYKTVTGIDPGWTTYDQFPNLTPVEFENLRPGDLWYGRWEGVAPPNNEHTGIVADVDGDGNYDLIHNGADKSQVHVTHDFLSTYLGQHTMGYRTVLGDK